jgi:hypothetical protein
MTALDLGARFKGQGGLPRRFAPRNDKEGRKEGRKEVRFQLEAGMTVVG